MLKLLLFASIVLFYAVAHLGIDISTMQGPFSVEQWECFRNTGGIDFAIIQIWRGHHQLSDHFSVDYSNAKAAGIERLDAYIFVCNNCTGNTPDNICSNVVDHLPQEFDGMVWLDAEATPQGWTGTPADRLAYLEDIAIACMQRGLHLGVYSAKGPWSMVFGSSNYTSGMLTALPLWYGFYDNQTSMNDYPNHTFGDWKVPFMKQYNAFSNICDEAVDVDYY